MSPLKNRAEIETILGMVNYLSKFSPSLSNVNAPLRQLLWHDNEFVWNKQRDAAFKKTKDIITREPGPVQALFDTSKDLTLQEGASKYRLGAVLLQKGKPLAYASKIEKEHLAILWGFKRFHQYVYGWHITVESDHKSLEAIVRKPLAAAPPRPEDDLAVTKYSFTIIHIPGKNTPVADTVSRKSMSCTDHSFSEEIHVLPVRDVKFSNIREETERHAQMSTLNRVIKGQLAERKRYSTAILEYWNHE